MITQLIIITRKPIPFSADFWAAGQRVTRIDESDGGNVVIVADLNGQQYLTDRQENRLRRMTAGNLVDFCVIPIS